MQYKEILVATSNNYKKEQFEYLFQDYDLKIKTLSDLPFKEKPKENKGTARENALLKARFWAEKVDIPVLADDAGLEIDALGGEPGVKARRWGGLFKDNVTDKEWLDYFLERMKNVPSKERTAKFKAAWAVVFPDGKEITKDIILPFYVLEKPRNGYTEGSPISAVRFNLKYQKAEMDLSKEEQWEVQKKEMENWKDFKEII